MSHSLSQSFDFVESLFLEGLFKARSFQKFSESKVFTKVGGQVLKNFSFVSSRPCLCFFPEIGPASVMVGNLVSGKRIAQASGRDLGQIEDNDQARKVGTGSPTLPDPPRPSPAVPHSPRPSPTFPSRPPPSPTVPDRSRLSPASCAGGGPPLPNLPLFYLSSLARDHILS